MVLLSGQNAIDPTPHITPNERGASEYSITPYSLRGASTFYHSATQPQRHEQDSLASRGPGNTPHLPPAWRGVRGSLKEDFRRTTT